MTYRTETDGNTSRIIMGDEKRPVFSLEGCKKLGEEIERLDSKEKIECITLTGNDGKFSSGLNPRDLVKHRKRTEHEELRKQLEKPNYLVRASMNSDTPIIARINGDIFGAGLGFALMCDLIVADESASVELSYINYSLSLDMGLSFFLPEVLGPYKAKEIAFSGEEYNIRLFEDAINYVVPSEELDEKVTELQEQILTQKSKAVSMNKHLINKGRNMSQVEETLNDEMWRQTSAFKWE